MPLPHHQRALWTALLLASSSMLMAQANTEATKTDAQVTQARAAALETYQGAWNVGQQRDAAELWNTIRTEQPANTEAQYNYFRSTRNSSLATNNGRIPAADQATLNSAAEELERVAPGSFESNMANFYLGYPDRAAFTELGKAYQKAPDRTELIGPMIDRAMLDNDRPSLERWARALRTRGGLAPGLIDAASDLLQSVDANGIVFTNGDMDTYPTVAAQVVDQQRTDVLVVDQRLLADPGYRAQVWSASDATGSAPGPGPSYAKALCTSTDRPVFLALSLDPSWFQALRGQLYASGLAFRLSSAPQENIPLLEQRWGLLRKPANAGPMSRNYLLPATVLLQYYRSMDDEANSSRMEAELRKFAERIGATPELYKAGILKH